MTQALRQPIAASGPAISAPELAASTATPKPFVVNKWGVAVAVALGAMLEVVDTSIVNVALNEMQNSLGATLSQVSWVVSSYAVANVIILPMTAWLGERFGKKRYFIFSLVGFTIASMLCGFATNLPMLILARVMQGIAGGGLMAKAQAILFETFPKEEQATAQGFFGAIVIAGPAIGPTLGGYIVTNINWRWIFFVNLPVGIAAVAMCTIFLVPDKEHARDTRQIDWLGIGLLIVGLGALQTMLEEGQSEDWLDSPLIIACAIGAALGLFFFCWRELTYDNPVVDLRVLRYRSLAAGSMLSVVVGMGLYGALFAVPIFAQTMLGLSSQQTGMLLLPGAIASAFTMPIAARLMRSLDPRVMLVIGALIIVGALQLLQQMTPQTGESDLFWPLIIRSFGTVMMFLPLSMATLGPVPKEDMGKASGFYNLTRQLGGSIGVAALTTLLAQRNAFHRNVLVEHLSASDPGVIARVQTYTAAMMAKGFDPTTAKMKALALLDGTVNAQAAVISFADTFWLTSALFVVTLPLVFLLGKGGGKVEMGH